MNKKSVIIISLVLTLFLMIPANAQKDKNAQNFYNNYNEIIKGYQQLDEDEFSESNQKERQYIKKRTGVDVDVLVGELKYDPPVSEEKRIEENNQKISDEIYEKPG